MTFTIEHFLISILILFGIAIVLLIIYLLGFLIFSSYCSIADIIDKSTVEKLIGVRICSVMTQHNSNLYSNSSKALKSENKIKSTKGGRK